MYNIFVTIYLDSERRITMKIFVIILATLFSVISGYFFRLAYQIFKEEEVISLHTIFFIPIPYKTPKQIIFFAFLGIIFIILSLILLFIFI